MRYIGIALAIAIAVLLPGDRALGQPNFDLEKRFNAETPPARAEIVHLILDFAPGVWLPMHKHGGPGYATVLEGSMTRRAEGGQQTFREGEGWVDPADLLHQAGNDTASPARIAATFVIPKGATLTTLAEGAEAPAQGATTFAEHRFEATNLPTPLELVHGIGTAPAGAQIPWHSHPGPTVVTILKGSGAFVDGSTQRRVLPGVTWLEPTDDVHGGMLVSDGPVQLLATHFIPRGAAHTVLAPNPAPVQMPVPGAR